MLSKSPFRPPTRQDLLGVIDLLQAISPYRPPNARLEDIWHDFLQQENVISLVSGPDGSPKAYGVVVIEQKIRGGKVGHIEDIVTHPQQRGKGLGRELVEELVEQAFAMGCYKVSLHCHPHNTVFYEKCGFLGSGNSLQRFAPPA